jgi:hypothetical protein
VLEKVDTYKSFGSDWRTLAVCFEADKYRFRHWLHAVGIEYGRIKAEHDPRLDDPTLKPLIFKILTRVCSIWGVGGTLPSDLEFEDYDDVDSVPGGRGMSALQKSTKSKRQMIASKTAKVGWALRGKVKFVDQVDSFEALVNRLYEVVPLATTEKSASLGAAIDPHSHLNMREGTDPCPA